jgi:pimeloyl-ACP methyl ester carboxylesterase
VYTLSYGPPTASNELFADQVAAKVAAIRAATGASRVALVGHSMGGVVARAYVRRHGGAHVHCLVTVGAPHHGSVHAWMFPGECLAQIRPGNAWLEALNAEQEGALPVRVVSLRSWHDSMVAPQASAQLGGADNVEYTGIGHNALIEDAGVLARIAEELRRVDARPAGGTAQ